MKRYPHTHTHTHAQHQVCVGRVLAETHVARMPGGICPCPLGTLCQAELHFCLTAAPLTHAASVVGLHRNNTRHGCSRVNARKLMTADGKDRAARARVEAQLTA